MRPQVTIATAIIFCHRFFLRQSHAKNDRRVSFFFCFFFSLLFYYILSLLESYKLFSWK
ncbi:cyclin-t1-5 [Phtheirospermum japonicum]|uniref:Cyclin-t1-5 n=1 Tax=Phtheirospermum japonicum TaxID=374723 RepID=A0A830BS93_9LAMI|nr:cyclin-t1-5 [Phtheirospermum japonicum]